MVLIISAVIVAASVGPALSARRGLIQGESALTAGLAELEAGDIQSAHGSFAQARDAFRRAEASAGSPILRVEGFVPFLGRTPDAVRQLTQIGTLVSAAGFDLTNGILGLPGGLASLAPHDGRLDLGAFAALAPAVGDTFAALQQAEKIASRLPGSFVLPPVRDAGVTVRDKLASAIPLMRSANELLHGLPVFAGADGPRRYFVAAQSLAESRGTGGLIGEYSVLRTSNGTFSLAPFRDIRSLPHIPQGAVQAPAGVADLYGRYVVSRFTGSNMIPDAPTAAALLSRMWEASGRGRLDGVIYIDPAALPYLLQATGPVHSPPLGITLTSGNVVAYTTHRAYLAFGNSTARKGALGLAAGEIWRRFITDAPPGQAVRAIASAAASGHIMLAATDPRLERAFRDAGVSGSFRSTGGDFVGNVVNNAAGNKMDFYLRRSVGYDVTLLPDGSARAVTKVSYSNTAPRNLGPSYVTKPYKYASRTHRLPVGDDLPIVGQYFAPGTRLDEALVGTKPLDVALSTQSGLPLAATDLQIAPQQTVTLTYRTTVPNAWERTPAGGDYRLTLRNPPAIWPANARVVIHLPAGTHATSITPGLRLRGNTATWTGSIGKQTVLNVVFGRTFPQRVWDGIRHFLDTPVIHVGW